MTTERTGLLSAAGQVFALAWKATPAHLPAYAAVMIGEALLPVVVAWLTKLVIDGLSQGSLPLIEIATALAAVGVAVAVLPECTRYLGAQIGRSFGLLTLDRLFQATERHTGLARFESPHYLDRLQMAQASIRSGESMITGGFDLCRSFLTLAGFVGSLLVISPTLTMVVLAGGLPALIAQLRLARRRAAVAWETTPAERRELFYGRLLSSLEAAKEVRLFGSAELLRGRMLDEHRAINVARRRMDLRELSTEGLLNILSAVIAGGGLLWAVQAARTGRLSAGDVSMLVATVTTVQSSLRTLITGLGLGHQDLLTFCHYLAVTRDEPDLPISVSPRPLEPLSRDIELRDVWFRYSEEHPWILRGVNLTIPYGATIALVGLNGAGKSTLVKLLCRFYDPTRGAILWDGADLRDVDPANLRQRMSCVFQDFMEYDLSAADNIGIADPPRIGDLDRVSVAAGRSGVDDTLRALPKGYDTLLTRMFFSEGEREDGEAGVELSGGQWQRVALARAFLREDPDLMILDEPSSGLDPEAEHDVHTRMRAHRRGRSSLLISHRLNTVRDADHIVVLDDGVIAEQGTHGGLMAADGAYARLFRLQSSGYQMDEAAQ